METPEVVLAIATATSIAASLGLPAEDAVVPHNSNKLALRLVSSGVFARVAFVGHEVAQFEGGVAQLLVEVGAPVRASGTRVDPQVYTRDGSTVAL